MFSQKTSEKEIYLKNKIENWFHNAKIDYNIDGKIVDIFTSLEDGYFKITTIMLENHNIYTIDLYDYLDTKEQLYNIWMEKYASLEKGVL